MVGLKLILVSKRSPADGSDMDPLHIASHGWRIYYLWRRHRMETFSALLALGAGNSSVTGEFPSQRPVTRSFDLFFDLHLNKRLSKQSWGWWFETPSCSLWRHCNALWHKYEICVRMIYHCVPCVLLCGIGEFIGLIETCRTWYCH